LVQDQLDDAKARFDLAYDPIEDDELATKSDVLRNMWNTLLTCINQNPDAPKYINDVVQDKIPKYSIDASQLKLHIPESISTEIRAELLRNSIVPYKDGGIDLIAVIKIWKIILAKFMERIPEKTTSTLPICTFIHSFLHPRNH
jgi:hypothetical protein